MDELMIPYILIYEVMLFGRLIGVYSLIPQKVDSVIFAFLAGVGIAIILIDFIDAISQKKFWKYNYLLIIFIAAILLSAFYNHSNNLISNLKLILWQIMLMFVVYKAADNSDSKRLFNYVERVTIILSFIIITISLGMFFFRFNYVEKVDQLYYGLRMGFIENRLYGLFFDPNFGATISVVTIVLSAKDIYKKYLFPRVFNYINIFFQLSYIALSGSRTAIVEIIIVSGIGAFFVLYQINNPDKLLLRCFKSILALVITMAVFWTLLSGLKKFLPVVANALPGEITNVVVTKNSKAPEEDVSLTRSDVSDKEDISNDRFVLWKSATEIFESTPLLGTTPRNLVGYARKHLPDNYIARSAHTPHNFFFYLLATTGVFGTLPFLFFLLRRMFQSVKKLFIAPNTFANDFLFDNLVVLTILISACFLTDIVMVHKLGGFLFWLYLGKIVINFSAKKTVI